MQLVTLADPAAAPLMETTAKRSRRRISPEERASRRRKQHRELVARGRQRLRDHLATLRHQHATLQHAVTSIVHAYTVAQKKASTPTDIITHALFDGWPTTRDKYVEAVALHESIRLENERLEHRIDDHLRFQDAIVATISTDHEGSASPSPVIDIDSDGVAASVLNRRGFWMYFAQDDMPFYYEPYTAEQCEQLMADTYRSVQRMDAAFESHAFPTMAVNCFGWSVQRMLDESCKQKLRFHFSKQITTASSSQLRQQLVAQSWNIMNTPALYAQLYRNKMVEHLLQRVSDHTSVIIRSNPTRCGALSLRSFNMMRTFEEVDADGRRKSHIVVLVLAPQDAECTARQAAQGVHYIRAGFTHISFVEKDDATLQVSYSGMGCVQSEEQATFLLTEIGCVWFRWEQQVMPKRLVTAE